MIGKVDPDMGRPPSEVYETCPLADCAGEPPTAEDAAWAAMRAKVFVDTIRETFKLKTA